MPRFKCLGGNLYQETVTNKYYGRFLIRGSRSLHALDAITVKAARNEIARKLSDHKLSVRGMADDPFREPITFANIAKKWIDAGYPYTNKKPRAGKSLINTRGAVVKLIEYFESHDPEAISMGDCDRYHEWRTARTKRGPGHAMVEIELSTLSVLLKWAHRAGHISRYSLLRVPKYHTEADIKHCTAHAPVDDDELHLIANFLFDTKQSEVIAWQLLLEALTGCRAAEIRELRMSQADPNSPGWHNDIYLRINRKKRGMMPHILLEAAPGLSPLKDCLRAHHVWHQVRHPGSPWYLPGQDPSYPIAESTLDAALTRACKALQIPHRASHGMRAYYVNVMRSQGIDDSEISKRLGQRSGVHLVETTYGTSVPGWFGSKTLDFIPTFKPAWEQWLEQKPATNIIAI